MSNDFIVINPYSQEAFYSYELTSKELAYSALDELTSSNYTIVELTEKLDQLVELIKKNKKTLSTTISKEIGKTINDTDIEIDRAKVTIEAIRDARRALSGDLLESQNYLSGENKFGLVRHSPLGVVLAITPFNFPINLALHKIVPALAMGNSVLFKPHPQCYESSKILTSLFYEAGFKKNDLSMICPSNDDMEGIISHPKVTCVSFTGGIAGAKAVSSRSVMKKQLFELGGNDALAIFPGGDYQKAVKNIISQRFGCAGQRCTASKRIFIHKECYEEVKNILIKETKKLKVGDPLDKEVFLGPVVTEESAKIIEKRILEAIETGARLLSGGKRMGAIIEPTIIEEANNEMSLIKDETFGPVAPLFKFNDVDDLIFQINSSAFGLQCGVFTNDIKVAKKLFAKVDVGAVIINEGPGYRADHFPFGGSKSSGIGREGAKYALLEFSQPKTLIL